MRSIYPPSPSMCPPVPPQTDHWPFAMPMVKNEVDCENPTSSGGGGGIRFLGSIIHPIKLYWMTRGQRPNAEPAAEQSVGSKLIHSLIGGHGSNRIYTNSEDGTNWMVLTSDTFSVLCDINCHRWIVWLCGHSGLYPLLFIPSTEHYTFGSVHDVSRHLHSRQHSSFPLLALWDLLLNHQCLTIKNTTNQKPHSRVVGRNTVSPINPSHLTPVHQVRLTSHL